LKSFGVDTSVSVQQLDQRLAGNWQKPEEKSAFDVVLDSVPADKRLLS
jgi:ribosomal protein L7/L12